MELQGGYWFANENMKYFELLNRDAFLIGKGVLGSSSALRKNKIDIFSIIIQISYDKISFDTLYFPK